MKIEFQSKRIYGPKLKADGTRVLVTRLWPRGIRLDAVNLWLKDLGPTRPLLSAYKSGKMRWATFEKRYLEEIETLEPARLALSKLAQSIEGRRVTLLCACEDLKRCHTAPLKKYLSRWTGRL